MPARVLDGRAVVAGAREALSDRIERLVGHGAIRPRLAILRFADGGPGAVYAATLATTATGVGIEPAVIDVQAGTSFPALAELVTGMNRDPAVAGIVLVQPMPGDLNREEAVALVDPRKDVDGAHPFNAGRLVRGSSTFVPATALAVMAVLRHYHVQLAGRRAVVIGRSAVVGRPTAGLLLEAHATVVVCHTRTADLAAETRRADVLVSAAGAPGLVTADMVAAGAVVIDAGYTPTPDGPRGDVEFASVSEVAGAVTPVPGGVGRVAPMMVVEQTVTAAEANLLPG